MRIRWTKGAVVGLSVGALVAVNGWAWQHARAMTTFAPQGERTPPPEELTAFGKVRTLLFGVTVPKPAAASRPEDHGLRATEGRIAGPTGALAVLVFEGGPQVVVVVHGYANEHSQLFPTIGRLVDLGYTVVAPDLRGVGASDGHTTTLGAGEADDVAAIVAWARATQGDPRPVLYGFSMGAAAVIGAAGRLGVPVEAIVSEACFDRLSTTVGHRFRSMGLPSRGPSDLLLFWGFVQSGYDPWRIAPVEDARQVDAPALVVGGVEDARVYPEETRALAAAFPAGRLALLEGHPHAQLARADPDRWTRTVGDFLLEVAPP